MGTSDRATPAARRSPTVALAPDRDNGLTTRQASAARTREALINTGLRLAERTGLGGLSINLLVEEAGVSKGSFFHHFGDRTSYLLALHREFHDRIFAEILDAAQDTAPGPERLLISSRTYLDACLRNRGVRALLLEARAERPIADEIRARNKAAADFCRADFQAMGWPHSYESALLWIGLVVEAALIELDAGGRRPAVRAALARFTASPAVSTKASGPRA